MSTKEIEADQTDLKAAPGRAVDPLGGPVIASDVMTSRGLRSSLLSDSPYDSQANQQRLPQMGCKAARIANILQICLLFVVGYG